nr:protein translocase subunit SecF [Propionibacterium sp.]
MSDTATGAGRSGTMGLTHRLYTGQLAFEFVGRWKRWFVFSGVLILIAGLALAVFRLNLSIDFRGGTAFTVPTTVTATSIDDYRRVAQGAGLPGMADIQVSTIGDRQVRVETRSLDAEELGTMRAALAQEAGLAPEQVANSLIGATWGQQITQQGLIALVVFLVLVSLMIWAYFRDWKMSVAAIVALLHDLIVTLGVFAILQFAFSPASLIGMLTILGYSLYDTVVVFDKVRENVRGLERQNRTYSEAANAAVNQVLVRSINTTIIGVLPVAALLFAGTFILGVGPLKDLGLALFVGMIAGAYSSVFIATPLLALMREAEPAMKEHRARLARRAARKGTQVPAVPIATAGAVAVAPERLAAVPADHLPGETAFTQPPASAPAGERHQPIRTSRAERKKT